MQYINKAASIELIAMRTKAENNAKKMELMIEDMAWKVAEGVITPQEMFTWMVQMQEAREAAVEARIAYLNA